MHINEIGEVVKIEIFPVKEDQRSRDKIGKVEYGRAYRWMGSHPQHCFDLRFEMKHKLKKKNFNRFRSRSG